MKCLVACEFSGAVRRHLAAQGHDAWSCDLLPSEDNSPNHIIGDVLGLLNDEWDMMIAFPPCTHLAVSGARWWSSKPPELQREAIAFAVALIEAPIARIAMENPIGKLSTAYRKPDQIIQPWQHGHGETKATCIWLKNLPALLPTFIMPGREPRVHRMAPGPDRWKERSRTLDGVAWAMADQWAGRA